MTTPDLHRPFYYRPASPATPPGEWVGDLCIHGGTSGGVIAAVQARRLGHSVVLLVFGDHVGGMTSSGLGTTDAGNTEAFGGLAREFYQEVGDHYGTAIAWRFEPGVAGSVFARLLERHGVEVRCRQHLASVSMDGEALASITMDDGNVYRAKVFIDASYEGDLMARAGVSHTTGREANPVYNEIFNGIHIGHPSHNFERFVDPYLIAGDPSSGLLPGISSEPPGVNGEGDRRIQAYNFRLCLTQRDDRLPFPEPRSYDPERYTLLARHLATGATEVVPLVARMPNGKTDTNNSGAFSTDYIGGNQEWPQADFATREEIYQDHVNYIQGLLWFLTSDRRVPGALQEKVSTWGLAGDEFTQTGGWPPELYIREARRMVSDYVMTEHDCVGRVQADDPIGLAAYTMDSHHCRRLVLGGRVVNEGNVEIGGFSPYPISYRSIVPRQGECSNLLVPFALSASHIAFGSIRMEPVFMALSQSAATAAHLAIREAAPVQRIGYASLRAALLKDGQILEWPR
ncbi:MAG TPA: FAD-dependent oxidoreductase [Chthoniobacteraceae bacterium]|nr:FAD-dependent oxidoreductase [Chthoniobacteraceae bacterium]